MAVTKVYSVQVIGGAAVLSICCSFLGKLAALISTIPGPVIGGISFLLYGMIGTSGLRMLVDNKVDYSKSRNLTLTSVVFVTGLSGIALKLGNVELTGMVLACVVAMALSLVFYILDNKSRSTEMVATYMYKTAFNSADFGYGSTLSVFLVIECLVAVGIIQKCLGSAKGDGSE